MERTFFLRPASRLLVIVLVTSVHAPLMHGQLFTDAAPQQGFDILVGNDLFGSGLSVYDFDLDGWDDVTFTVTDDSLVFFRNVEGQFVRLPSFLYAPGATKHVLWVDYDNDGDLDLTVTTWEGTYRLYRNNGNFQFTDVSVAAGLAQNIENTYGASWADYDRDGDLDLYVCLYEYEGNQTNFPRFNHLYRNNGNGTFTDVSLEAGVSDGIQMSFQSVWFDYDQDGWTDLYVINDRWFPNTLYRNNGDGTFSDVTQLSGTALTDQDPMTASVADFDNDGDLDIYMTNTGWFDKVAMLLVNNGDGTFSDLAAPHGVDLATWAWGATWVDADNDGWQDLYVTTSMPNGPIMDNVFYHSNAGAGFSSSPDLFDGNHNARSFSVGRGDVDNDGAYDLAVQNQAPYPPFLWMNQGTGNNHVKITLRGTTSNRMAIGSWIRVHIGTERYSQYTHCGENYVGQNSQHHIIGIGQHDGVDSIVVQYPSGHVDTYHQVAAGSTLLLTEGETYRADIIALGDTAFCAGDSVVLDAGEHTAYLWNNGHTERFLTVHASGTFTVQVTNGFGVTGASDSLTIVVHPTPQIEAWTVNPLCDGDATGSIDLIPSPGTEDGNATWNTGAMGMAVTDLTAGIHTYTFVDIHGCSTSGSIELIAPPGLFIDVSSTPASGAPDGSIQIAAFGGVPPYAYALNGGPCNAVVEGLGPGTYDITVTDAYGCTITLPVEVGTFTSIAAPVDGSVVIRPNPTDGVLHIEGLDATADAVIHDACGREVFRQAYHPGSSLDLALMPSGHYLLLIMCSDGTTIRKRISRF